MALKMPVIVSSAPFPHSPSQAIDRPLSWAWATVGDFQPRTPSRPFPTLPLFSPPPSFLPPFLPSFLVSSSPSLPSFLPSSFPSPPSPPSFLPEILTLHLLCAKHSDSNTVAAKTDPRASILVREAASDQPTLSEIQPELRLFGPSLS